MLGNKRKLKKLTWQAVLPQKCRRVTTIILGFSSTSSSSLRSEHAATKSPFPFSSFSDFLDNIMWIRLHFHYNYSDMPPLSLSLYHTMLCFHVRISTSMHISSSGTPTHLLNSMYYLSLSHRERALALYEFRRVALWVFSFLHFFFMFESR